MENRNEEFRKMKAEYKMAAVPKEGKNKMEEAIWRAKMDKKRENRKKIIRNAGLCAAAALVLVGLPNMNSDIAYAMGNLPLVGGLFRAVTIREYNYDDGNNNAAVVVPNVIIEDENTGVSMGNSDAVNTVNKSVEEYIAELTEEFKREMQEEGHMGLDVSYETVMDRDDWFTLKITVVKTQASGYEFSRFYHIDKKNDKVVCLKDLFPENPDYIRIISEEIKKQMKEQMEDGTCMYFLEGDELVDGFSEISENQNFYFNADGNLVIVFNEYEVGPGSIGAPEFVMPEEIFHK
ncbi:MAG: RsiV family protein [Thermoflexaceae bacterium]|nr:RsiV family protein [Thermoflexaceae bacterium]